jgi:hypothetical protein
MEKTCGFKAQTPHTAPQLAGSEGEMLPKR